MAYLRLLVRVWPRDLPTFSTSLRLFPFPFPFLRFVFSSCPAYKRVRETNYGHKTVQSFVLPVGLMTLHKNFSQN